MFNLKIGMVKKYQDLFFQVLISLQIKLFYIYMVMVVQSIKYFHWFRILRNIKSILQLTIFSDVVIVILKILLMESIKYLILEICSNKQENILKLVESLSGEEVWEHFAR